MRLDRLSALVSPLQSFSAIGLLAIVFFSQLSFAQQTLGSINGTVVDSSGAVVQGATVKALAVATNLSVKAQSKNDGSFAIADLPIGTYEVTFTKDGFERRIYPQIIVQGSRTSTVNTKLKPGAGFHP